MSYLGDNLDSSSSFLNSSLASSSLFFFSLYSSLIRVLTNCSNILSREENGKKRSLNIRKLVTCSMVQRSIKTIQLFNVITQIQVLKGSFSPFVTSWKNLRILCHSVHFLVLSLQTAVQLIMSNEQRSFRTDTFYANWPSNHFFFRHWEVAHCQ